MRHFTESPSPFAASHGAPATVSRGLSRRGFIGLLGASAASFALQGCGGGGASTAATAPAPVAPAPVLPATPVAAPAAPVAVAPVADPMPAPTWLPIPPLLFTQGVAASVSIAGYVSAANLKAFSLSLAGSPLPAGVTFNAATYAFDYDGRGTTTTSDGHVLVAAVA